MSRRQHSRNELSDEPGAVHVLILCGWIDSVRQNGGELHDWYFAIYELIYLLWPWDLEARFFFPIAPLALFYLWRGLEPIGRLLAKEPRITGGVAATTSFVLAVCTWYWIKGYGFAGLPAGGLQGELSLTIWGLTAVVAALVVITSSSGRRWARVAGGRSMLITGVRSSQGQVATASIILGLIATRVAVLIPTIRANTNLASAVNTPTPDVRAALWVAVHTAPSAVLMASHFPIVSHYSGRHVIWFPPSTNAQMLMGGIQRFGVDYILVMHRDNSYYRPPEDSCFAVLEARYPNAFQLMYHNSQTRIYRTSFGIVPSRESSRHGSRSLRPLAVNGTSDVQHH